MVLKPAGVDTQDDRLFENDVKTYGTQTSILKHSLISKFENDVKTYGTQTLRTFSQIILVV